RRARGGSAREAYWHPHGVLVRQLLLSWRWWIATCAPAAAAAARVRSTLAARLYVAATPHALLPRRVGGLLGAAHRARGYLAERSEPQVVFAATRSGCTRARGDRG